MVSLLVDKSKLNLYYIVMEVNYTSKFEKWLKALKDKEGKSLILFRFTRIEYENHFGDYKSVGKNLFELRINSGPGYRIYFSKEKDGILLLAGGTKSNQTRIIKNLKK